MIAILLIVAIALALFYTIVFRLDIPGSWKFFLVAIEMIAVNQIFIKRYKLPSEIGLVLVKSKKGIEMIDRLARSERAFNFMADVGASISYGLLSLPLMRRNVSLPSMALGIGLLLFLTVFVAPIALSFLFHIVGIGGSGTSGGTISAVSQGTDYGMYLVGALLVGGGIFLLILFGIVFYGLVVFKAIVTTIFFGTNAIASTASGADILLPGVNLPFFEGLAALVIVLVVHEGAHAVLARIAKVPILSSGIVLFGVIPIGAFVEPDEKKLARVEAGKQTRVLVAGPTANMLTAAAFFILFMGFFLTTADMRESVLYVMHNDSLNFSQAQLPQGLVIYEIGGQPVSSIDFASLSLPPDGEVRLATNRGEIIRATDANGKMGIYFSVLEPSSLFSRYSMPFLQSIYTMLGLCVALNFMVGAVNILPIPLFDGYRIVDVNVRNKTVVQALSYAALFFFILNFLPRLFQ